jgi:hypothetical protein
LNFVASADISTVSPRTLAILITSRQEFDRVVLFHVAHRYAAFGGVGFLSVPYCLTHILYVE